MKTQISILVKKESLMSKMQSFLWFINIFKKTSVAMCIDGDEANATLLVARKEPYLIDVTPGYHELVFADPKAANKQAYKKFTGATVGAIFAIATEGAIGVSDFTDNGSTVRDGYLQCNLVEGDLLRISVKAKQNGSVKVKVLKK